MLNKLKSVCFLTFGLLLIFQSSSSKSNPINEHIYKNESCNSCFNFFIEIPAGTKEKWEVNHKNGILEHEEKNGKKRIVNFLPYPGNYGFIPQTLSGDNDPIDLIDLDESEDRGKIKIIKVLGGLYYEDKKEKDVKLIGVGLSSTFKNYENLNELLFDKPKAVEIINAWFSGYKKPGKMVFYKYLTIDEAIDEIEKGHKRWLKKNN